MQATAEKTDVAFVELKASNFMRLSAFSVRPEGKHVIVNGKNGSGKSSACAALWAALCGISKRKIPEPIRKGQERATIELDLGRYRVRQVFSEKGETLVLTGGDGERIARPREALEAIFDGKASDLGTFLNGRPQDQVDAVLGMAGVPVPVDQVREITGLELSAREGESADAYLMRLSADETGVVYSLRRDAHRLREQKAAALREQESSLVALRARASESGPPATEILKEIEQLSANADDRRKAQDQAAESQREAKEGAAKVRGMQAERDKIATGIKRIDEQIAALKRDRAAQESLDAALLERIQRNEPIVAELEEQARADAKELAAIADPTPQLAECRARLKASEQGAAARAKLAAGEDQLKRLGSEHAQAVAEHKARETQLEALRDLRRHLLDGHDLGVPGLGIGDGELRLNDVPFRQASQAEQIRTACAVTMRRPQSLRLVILDGGEALDIESRRILLDMATERGFSVFMTSVEDGDGLRVEIVNGE